ncbi:MAG: rhodanese-like domain-containing protein, partial [Saprospiraceae bacterium]|nr:rhodanese-like domain-containing protein [Saprospiraceae bacterium]
NKKGYGSFEEAMSRGLNPQSVEQFKAMIAQNDVILLDVRDKKEFVESHIPGSMFIGLDGSFAPWVGALITDINQKIALVCPVGREEETVRRLARVGYDNAVGYLDGGFESWKNASEETASIDTITVEEFVKSDINKQVVDVRNTSEYSTTHFCGSLNVPLDHFPTNNTDVLDKEKSYFVHCRSGFRSTVASSILKRRGIHNITNVIGSFDVIKENLEVEGTCPSLIA